MASLTGTKIQDTYDGLLKVSDNVGINSTKKIITDGLGNNSSVKISSEDFEVGGFFFVDIDGNIPDSKIGIGTNAPTETLHVVGDFRLTARFYDGSNSAGSSGKVLVSTGNATSWTDTFTTSMVFDSGVQFNAGIKDYTGSKGTAGQVLSSTGSNNFDVEWVSLSEIQGVDGSGTANYIPVWTDSDTIGNSVIYQSNSNIGIGTLSPGSYKLNVFGDFKLNSNGSGYMQSDYGDHRISIFDSSNNRVFTIQDLDGSSANQLVVASTGVGINVANPSEKLHVVGDALITGDSHADTFKPAVTSNPIKFKNFASTELARITDAGLFGIGTTAPSYKLSVTTGADIVANFYSTDSKSSILINDDDTSGWLGVEDSVMFMGGSSSGTGSINILTGIGNTGHVGIGTASPSQKLEINGNALINNSSNGKLYFGSTDHYVGKIGADLYYYTTGQNIFYSGGSEQMRIKTNGNVLIPNGSVGIGTTNPVEKLQINSGDVLINNSTISTLKSGGSLYIDLNTFGSYSGRNFRILDNGTALVNVNQTGEVGIGTTSPGRLLHLYKSTGTTAIKIEAGDTSQASVDLQNTDSWFRIITNGGALRFWDQSNNTERIRINSSGNLGIGTTSPGQKLHVSGTIRTSGTNDLDIYSDSTAGTFDLNSSTRGFLFKNNNGDLIKIENDGQIKLNEYGSGTFTGTTTYRLAVDSSGNVIEIPIGSGAVDGSGAANKIAIWSDADTLTSDTNLHWDSTNDRLGVGLSNPSYTIHIPDGASNINTDHAIAIGNDADIKLYRHSNTGVNVIEGDGHLNIRTNTITFQNQAGTETLFKAVADGAFEAYYNNAKELETISQGVNIRVKSIIPSAGNTNGGYWLYGTHAHGFVSNTNGDLRILASTPGGQKEVLRSYIGTASRLVIDGNNYYNVGIGTTTPSEKLHVSGEVLFSGTGVRTTKTVGTDSSLEVQNGISIFRDTNTVGWLLNSDSSNHLGLYNWNRNGYVLKIEDNTPAGTVYINASGNIGIGTTSPGEKLTVSGNIESLDTFILNYGNNGNKWQQLFDGANGWNLRYYNGISWSSNYININTSGNATFAGDIYLLDDKKLRLGTSSDLQIYHKSSNDRSYIYNGTGDLYIENDATDGDIKFLSDDGSGGTTEYFRVDGGITKVVANKNFIFEDGIQAQFGSSADLNIYHSGTSSVIQNATGNLTIQQDHNNSDIIFRCDDGSNGTTEYFKLDGTNTRILVSKPINLIDDVPLQLGNSQDLRIYHNGNNSYIQDAGIGSLKILAQDFDVTNSAESALMIRAIDGAQVELYYGGAKKFETNSQGATVTGGLTVTGDLNIYGDINTQNINNLDVVDKVITVGKGQLESASGGSGIVVDGSGASILWNELNNEWELNKDLSIYTGAGLATFIIGRNPSEKLTIDQTDNETVFTAINDADGDSEHNFRFNRVFQGTGANNFKIQKGGTDQLTIDTNANATFSGSVEMASGKITSDGSAAAGAYLELKHANNNSTDVCATINLTNNVGGYAAIVGGTTGANNTGYIEFKTDNAGTQGTVLTLNGDNSATFAGYVKSALGFRMASGQAIDFIDTNIGYNSIERNTTVGGLQINTGASARINILDTGNIGIGTTSPSFPVHVYTGGSERFAISGDVFVRGATDLKITGTSRRLSFDSGTGTVRTSTSNNLILQTNNTTALTLDTSQNAIFDGQVNVGTDSPSSNGNYGTGDLNVENDTFAAAQIMSHNSTAGNFSFLGIGKSSGTGASPTIVQANETVGLIGFYGYDGNAYKRIADIRSKIDGTPGTNDMPGNLEFYTTSDGSAVPTKRLTIGQDGNATFEGNVLGKGRLTVGQNAVNGSYGLYAAGSFGVGGNATFAGDIASSGNIYLNNNKTVFFKNTSGSNYGLLTITNGNVIKLGAYSYTSAATQIGLGDNGSFLIGSSTVMKIDSSGKVGIGNTSPSEKLHVATSNNTVAKFESTDANANIRIGDTVDNTHIGTDGGKTYIGSDTSVGGNNLTILSDGKVGIGTGSPSHNLTVSSSSTSQTAITIGNTSTGASRLFIDASNGDTSGSDYMWFGQNDDLSGEIYMTQNAGSFHIKTQPSGTTQTNFTVTQAGNIGIGTSTPSVKFEVNGGSSVAAFFKSSANTVPVSLFTTNNAISTIGFKGLGSTSEYHVRVGTNVNDFVAYTNNTERMRITSAGNIGIGTTSPVSALHIESANPNLNLIASSGNPFFRIGNATSGSRKELTFTYDMTSNYASIQAIEQGVATRNIAINPSGGKVGIGTTSPQEKFAVTGGNIALDNGGAYILGGATTSSIIGRLKNTSGVYTLDGEGTRNIRLGSETNGEVVRIDNTNGNVGIGTTAPSEKLEVEGNILVTSDSGTSLKIQAKNASSFNDPVLEFVTWNVASGASSGKIQLTNGAWNNNDMAFFTETSNSVTEKMRIASNGNIGIGTTTPTNFGTGSHLITVQSASGGGYGGFIAKTDNVTGQLWANEGGSNVYLGTRSNHPLILTINNLEKARIDTSGNIGIGTTSPSEKLEISGTGELSAKINNTQYSRSFTITQGGGYSHLKTSHSSGVAINYGQGNVGILSLFNNTTQVIKINANGNSYFNGGNIGIGTTSPERRLTVGDGSGSEIISIYAGNTNASALHFTDTNTSTDYQGFVSYNHNVDALRFGTAEVERMRLSTDGYLGINTTLPVNPLHVEGNFTLRGNQYMGDNEKLILGLGSDLQIYHDGTDSDVINNTGHLLIKNNAANKDVSFYADSQTSGTTEYIRIDGSLGTTRFFKNARFSDNIKANFGDGEDLKIFHNGSDSFIINETGNLKITQGADDKDIVFECDDGTNGTIEYFRLDGSATKITINKEMQFFDTVKASFGNAADLKIYHSGSHSFISDEGTGDLKITTSAGAVRIDKGVSENMAAFFPDGAVELYYNNSKKFETTSDGVLVSGFLESKKADTGAGYNDGIARFVNETTATSGGSAVINVRNTYGIGFGGLIKFWSTSTATSIGNISFNSSRTAVNYNTGSDYRLKEDYRDFNGLDLTSKIKVYDFKWKNQDDRSYGVIAHELDQVVSGAVTGEKDAEDMQCVDYSKLVPLLIKSVQELKDENLALKARVSALENN